MPAKVQRSSPDLLSLPLPCGRSQSSGPFMSGSEQETWNREDPTPSMSTSTSLPSPATPNVTSSPLLATNCSPPSMVTCVPMGPSQISVSDVIGLASLHS